MMVATSGMTLKVNVGAAIITALKAQQYTHLEDLRPEWVDNV